jgi:hypothetical protein
VCEGPGAWRLCFDEAQFSFGLGSRCRLHVSSLKIDKYRGGNLGGWYRPAKEVALSLIAFGVTDKSSLPSGFDTFDGDTMFKARPSAMIVLTTVSEFWPACSSPAMKLRSILILSKGNRHR